MGKNTSAQDYSYSQRSGVSSGPNNGSLIEAIKALFYPWIKEAVADAYREQKEHGHKQYPERVTVAQASEITGYSRNSLYQMHSRGTIPGALKVGGKLLFDTATLQEWVRNGGVQD